MSSPRDFALVFVGAAAGGALRFGLDRALGTGEFAWDLVAINVVGSAALGLLMGAVSRPRAPRWLPAIGPGFLGGFTTFSALAAPHPGHSGAALALLLGTTIASVAAAAAGLALGERLAKGQRVPAKGGKP